MYIDSVKFSKNKLIIDDSIIWPNPREIEIGNFVSHDRLSAWITFEGFDHLPDEKNEWK